LLDLLLVLNLKNCQLRVERVGKRDADLASSGDRARGAAAGVEGVLALVVFRLVGGSVDTGTDVAPGTVVQWLFL
jgi:hypothetical protein